MTDIAPVHAWVYRCRIERVIDGDTLQAVVCAGFNLDFHTRLRLLGVNTPELRGATRQSGLVAKRLVEQWVEARGAGDWPFLIRTEKDPDSFGRYLAELWGGDDPVSLNSHLLTLKIGRPYP